MMERLRSLGLPGVSARTFHAHALSQLRHFWPLKHDGAPLPEILSTKLPILSRLARGLPGHYRFTPAKDLADEIEWAKSRRVDPAGYEAAAAAAGREPPLPVDLFVRAFADYERAKARAGRLDFDDMLIGAVDLLEHDPEAAEIVRARKRWFSVDEYQDTNPLQQRLLELWAGGRPDVCVVGDEDQTIYTFTGATSDYLTSFAERHAGTRVIALTENYRSSPEVLDLANRLIASAGRSKLLTATRPSGPRPTITRHATAEAELSALAAGIQTLLAAGDRTRRSRRARPDECPARTDRGGPDAGRDRLPGSGTRVLATAGGQGRDRAGRTRRGRRSGRASPARSGRSGPRSSGTKRARLPNVAKPANAPPRSRRSPRSSPISWRRIRQRTATCCWRSSGDERQRRKRRPPPVSSSRRTTARRASSGTPSSCRCSRKASCRSASRSTMTPRSRRSDGCSTSGSPGPGSTLPCRGRSSARPEAASRAGARAGSWTASYRDPAGARARSVTRRAAAGRAAGGRVRIANRAGRRIAAARGVAGVANGTGADGRGTRLCRRPRFDARRNRRGPTGVSGRTATYQGHGPAEARALRCRDPGRHRRRFLTTRTRSPVLGPCPSDHDIWAKRGMHGLHRGGILPLIRGFRPPRRLKTTHVVPAVTGPAHRVSLWRSPARVAHASGMPRLVSSRLPARLIHRRSWSCTAFRERGGTSLACSHQRRPEGVSPRNFVSPSTCVSLADAPRVPRSGLAAGLAHRRTGRSLLPDHGPDPGHRDHHHLGGRSVLVPRGALLPRTRELHPDRRLGPQRRYVPRLRQRSLQRLRGAPPLQRRHVGPGRRDRTRATSRSPTSAATSSTETPATDFVARATTATAGPRTSAAAAATRTPRPRSSPRTCTSRRRSPRTAATGGTSRMRSSSGSASACGSTARRVRLVTDFYSG